MFDIGLLIGSIRRLRSEALTCLRLPRITTLVTVVTCLALAETPGLAQSPGDRTSDAAPAGSVWVTLGTMSGPIPSASRSQPANLLLWRDQTILVDAGDGAAEQLAKAGVSLAAVRTIFISHLHFDHTGGMFALLSMRFQGLATGAVSIYGPPGTRRLIEGLQTAMQPTVELMRRGAPEIIVHEINDGDRVALGDVTVTAAANSHFATPPLEATEARRTISLSYRFDMPDRSIAFTGDTGPSADVERLAHDVDLLVSEVMNPDGAMAELQQARPDLPQPVLAAVRRHFTEEHLTPSNAGLLASRARARRLVLTHVGGVSSTAALDRLRAEVATQFTGNIMVAKDLDRF